MHDIVFNTYIFTPPREEAMGGLASLQRLRGHRAMAHLEGELQQGPAGDPSRTDAPRAAPPSGHPHDGLQTGGTQRGAVRLPNRGQHSDGASPHAPLPIKLHDQDGAPQRRGEGSRRGTQSGDGARP